MADPPQVKFSELTLDMFRMLQTLEREPQEDTTQLYDASPAPGRVPFPENGGTGDSRPGKRENPHKYLLYKPTFSQLFVFLASGFKELPPNGVLLLYVSADGSFPNVKHPEEVGYDYGGVTTNSKREPDHSNKRNIQLKDMHWPAAQGQLADAVPAQPANGAVLRVPCGGCAGVSLGQGLGPPQPLHGRG